MQQPRHASRRTGAGRLRALLRGGIVGMVALPSLLAVGAAVSGVQPANGMGGSPASAFPGAVAALTGAAVGGPGAGTTGVPDPPRPSVPPVARSAVRAGRPARRAPAAPVRRIVGLGDSVPAGSACDCTDYVRLLAAALGRSQGGTVRASNLASPGETSGTLADRIGTGELRAALGDADAVVVTVGANDIEGQDPTTCQAGDGEGPDDVVAGCFAGELDALERNLDTILDTVARTSPAPRARVLVTGYWDVYVDGAVARARGPEFVRRAEAATRAVNRIVAAAARAHGDTYVDLFTPFRGADGDRDDTALLAPDGDHPDADGHALVARTLAAALS